MESDAGRLGGDVRGAWHRFVDLYEPLRPDLYRYARYLSRSPWDAEDLVQDTLARAFVTLGSSYQEPANPKAWLFRVASNLWIDRVRRARELPGEVADQVVEPDIEVVDRTAAASLIGRLAPKERAAVVLKDVFDFTLAEIAESLTTTVGAVKAALHRGRGKLQDSDAAPAETAPPPVAVLDAFVAAFNARDIDGLTALLLDTSVAELVGVVVEQGPDAMLDPETGSIPGFLTPITSGDEGALPPDLLVGYRPLPPRAEVREVHGEQLVLFWYQHDDGEAVRNVLRVEATPDDRVQRLRHYFFAPDVLAEVCRELDVPFRTNGYRYWPKTGDMA